MEGPNSSEAHRFLVEDPSELPRRKSLLVAGVCCAARTPGRLLCFPWPTARLPDRRVPALADRPADLARQFPSAAGDAQAGGGDGYRCTEAEQ